MPKITIDNVSTAQKAIWEAWLDRQGQAPAELLAVYITDFAREMGIDVTDPEAIQLADLKRCADKRAAKLAQSTPTPAV